MIPSWAFWANVFLAQNGAMAKPVPYARTIVTDDGVPIDAAHLPGDPELAIVLAHGFTLNWQRPAVLAGGYEAEQVRRGGHV